jgi:diguanylate cyclase (GGDEF)-like protein/PAS domain S-box-containing protein
MGWVRAPIVLFLVAALAIGGSAVAAMAMYRAGRLSDAVATQAALDLGDVERLRGLRERSARKARTFSLTGDDRALRELRASERAFSDLLSRMRRAAGTPEERELYDRIEEHGRLRGAVRERLVAARKAGMSTESVAHMMEGELQPIVDTLDAAIANLVDFHRRQVERASVGSEKVFSQAARGLWAATAIALLVAALTSLVLARTLRRVEGRAGRLQRERDRFFELSIDMVCIAGTDGYFKQLNPAFEATLGYTRAELLARPFLEFVHVDDREATLKQLENLSAGRTSLDFENRYECKDGTFRWLCWHASPESGGAIYAVARDITERKADEEHLVALTEALSVMAVVDDLTGLHNRRGFIILAEQQLKRATRSQQKAVFFLADVDDLKQINDNLGHGVGDQAIRDAATLLAAAFRKSDIVARLGGDEFVVLAADTAGDHLQAPIDRFQQMIRQFNSSELGRPFRLAISIGSTIYDPEQPETIEAILKRADEMMYEQKAGRKSSGVVVLETRMRFAKGGGTRESPT